MLFRNQLPLQLTSNLSTNPFKVTQWVLFLWTSSSFCFTSLQSLWTSQMLLSLSCVILSILCWSTLCCSVNISKSLICVFNLATWSFNSALFLRLWNRSSLTAFVSCLLFCNSFFTPGSSNNNSCNWWHCPCSSLSSFCLDANSFSRIAAAEGALVCSGLLFLVCSYKVQLNIETVLIHMT